MSPRWPSKPFRILRPPPNAPDNRGLLVWVGIVRVRYQSIVSMFYSCFTCICLFRHLFVFGCSVVVDTIYPLARVVSSSTHVSSFYFLCLPITLLYMGLDPHQPWHVPSEYLELYPNPIDKLPAPKHPYSPIGMPDIAVRVASE